MAQARISLPSTITYSQSNPASLAQSDHGAKIPVNNKGAFTTDRQQASASSTVADEEVGSEIHVPSEPDAVSEESVPSQPVPRISRSGDGQSPELVMGGHSEWPSGAEPLGTGADRFPSSLKGLHPCSGLLDAASESDSLVVGYPVLVPAELGETVWEHGVSEEDIFLPRAECSGAVVDSFCDEGYWNFLLSATPDSRPGEVDSHLQEKVSAARARDFEIALVLEYERERCLDGFADGASYASVLEKQFGMNMSWSAPPMSIRKRGSKPFIFPHQHRQKGYIAAFTTSSAHNSVASSSAGLVDLVENCYAADASHESIKAVLEHGRSRSPRSSPSLSRASPAPQDTVSGEEFRDVICAAAAPPAEVDSHALSWQSSPACSRTSSSAISRDSSPVRSSLRSLSPSTPGWDSSYVPSDAEGPSGASRKRKSGQKTRPQVIKGDKAHFQDSIPSSAVAGEKRKRAALASRQPPSTKPNVNHASTSIPERPRVYAVEHHGDIQCPWPDCSHSTSVLQMRHHLKKHRHDASSCYWPGCQMKHFSSAPRHIDDHHLKIEWVCPACHSTFKSERSGNRHIRQSCEAWQGANVEEVKENWISDDDGQQSTRSELKSLGNERVVDERLNKRRET